MSYRGKESAGTKDTIHELTQTPTSITVKWQSAESESDSIFYRVKYRINSCLLKEKFQVMNTRGKEVTLTWLMTNTEYEVTVVWVDKYDTEHLLFRDVKATSNSDEYNGKTHLHPTPTTITVKWQNPRRENIQSYQVKYRSDKDKPFETLETICQEKEITGLKERTKYEVLVFWVGPDGYNHVMFGDFVTTLQSNESEGIGDERVKPERNYAIVATSTTLTVDWNVKAFKVNESCISYQVRYRINNSKERQQFTCKESETSKVEITCLKPSTSYLVKVYWVNDEGDTHMMFQDEATTFESKSAYLKDSKMSFVDSFRKPAIFHMKPVRIQTFDGPKKDDGQNMNLRICDMICEYEQHCYSTKEKTILFVGAISTGKSTMITALINYIAGVSYSDDHRFDVIPRSTIENEDRVKSQTSSITIYRIPKLEGSRVDYKINIIDTPRFDDTRGCFDNTITDQMENFFRHHLEYLDAIFIVVPIATRRLTSGQRHVFTNIVKMFGKDMENNVFILFTYDDGGDSNSCMKVLSEAGIKFNSITRCFRFDNSNVLATFHGTEEREARVWESRTTSFTKLFGELAGTQRTHVQSCSQR